MTQTQRHAAMAILFPWVITAAGAQWLGALVQRLPWDRCGVE
jgi:hypothetical protein